MLKGMTDKRIELARQMQNAMCTLSASFADLAWVTEALGQAMVTFICAVAKHNPWIYDVDVYRCFWCRGAFTDGHSPECPYPEMQRFVEGVQMAENQNK